MRLQLVEAGCAHCTQVKPAVTTATTRTLRQALLWMHPSQAAPHACVDRQKHPCTYTQPLHACGRPGLRCLRQTAPLTC